MIGTWPRALYRGFWSNQGISKKYAAQRPYKNKEDRSGGNKKRGTTTKFYSETKEVNTKVSHYAPIPRENKGLNQKKKPKSEQDNSSSSEDGRTYCIDRLNFVKPVNDSESDSGLILTQCR